MIQRIQSLYLVIVVILSGLSFAFPLAIFESANFSPATYNLIPAAASGDVTYIPQTTVAWNAIAFPVVIGLLSLIAIFLYKNRMRQVKFVAVAFLLGVIYVGFLFLWIVDAQATALASQNVESIRTVYGISSYIPIAQIILLILAQRAIRNDEKLVRSSERLR